MQITNSTPWPIVIISALLTLFLLMRTTLYAETADLKFNPDQFTVKTLIYNDQRLTYRAYEDIVYVAHPVAPQFQNINIYVPMAYYEGQSVGAYQTDTAPIFLPNRVGGYMPAKPGGPALDRNNHPNAATVALSKGYVVACPGVRGRTLQDDDGLYIGKAPACIVDLKAAVRYLRYNDALFPGDAEKIVSNGTSAGGALSALLGATGNSPDYDSYLQIVGAAPTRDDIYAASCYCPITNLDHADMAYKWQFNGLNQYNAWGRKGTLSVTQIQLSNQLKALFPPYVNHLGLKTSDGTLLTLNENGHGPFRNYVKSFILSSAQHALDHGENLSNHSWITIEDGKVTEIDIDAYVAYATRMKATPAFDALDLHSPENNLFGTTTLDNQHFTAFARNQNPDHDLADTAVIKMMNPMNYIGTSKATTAQHWRIRHGAIDRDTSLAIPVILATQLMNHDYEVDFALPWGQGHGGDYDLDELFAWMAEICQ